MGEGQVTLGDSRDVTAALRRPLTYASIAETSEHSVLSQNNLDSISSQFPSRK